MVPSGGIQTKSGLIIQNLAHRTIVVFFERKAYTQEERERFLFRNIPDPYHTKDLLMALQKRQERKEAGEIGEAIRKKMNPTE